MKYIKTFEDFLNESKINENHISPRDIDSKSLDKLEAAAEDICNDLIIKGFNFSDIENYMQVTLNQVILPFKKKAKK